MTAVAARIPITPRIALIIPALVAIVPAIVPAIGTVA